MAIVYSTDKGRHPNKGKKASGDSDEAVAGDGFVSLQRQVKGRNGKPVILVSGLPGTTTELKKLAKQLKAQCGVGGSLDGRVIIIQGDKRDQIQATLEKLGHKVKRTGG